MLVIGVPDIADDDYFPAGDDAGGRQVLMTSGLPGNSAGQKVVYHGIR